MPREFLASFAVDIDEGGANRLQSILARNRELAGAAPHYRVVGRRLWWTTLAEMNRHVSNQETKRESG